MADKIRDKLIDAPCIFCGYNGPGYFQRGSHKVGCPWHSIGGAQEREDALNEWLLGIMARNFYRERAED